MHPRTKMIIATVTCVSSFIFELSIKREDIDAIIEARKNIEDIIKATPIFIEISLLKFRTE